MERSEVEARVRKVIIQVLKVDESEVGAEANFIFDLGADSVQSILLVAAFEEEFEVELEEDEALAIQTVSDAVSFIKGVIDA